MWHRAEQEKGRDWIWEQQIGQQPAQDLMELLWDLNEI